MKKLILAIAALFIAFLAACTSDYGSGSALNTGKGPIVVPNNKNAAEFDEPEIEDSESDDSEDVKSSDSKDSDDDKSSSSKASDDEDSDDEGSEDEDSDDEPNSSSSKK